MDPKGVIHTADHDRLEQVYTLQVAAELIPFPTAASLTLFLSRHKEMFPARYRSMGFSAPHRMLYECELIAMREMTIVEKTHMAAKGRGRRVRGIIDTMIARCQS